nr:hypothetical protein RTCK_03554 [Rhizobium sp. TCK]
MIHNERTKLTANWLNAMASGVIITGVVAPSIAVLFQLSMGIGVSPLLLVAASGVWLSSGIALDLLGRKVRGRLM